MIMKRFKEMMKDACVYMISFISILIFFNEIFNWMMYV